MKKIGFAIFLITYPFLLNTFLYKAHGKESVTKQELKKLDKDINKTKQIIKGHDRQERSILTILNNLDKKIDGIGNEIEIYEYNLAQNQKKIEDIKKQILVLDKEIECSLNKLKARLRAIYKSGGIGIFKVLFATRSISDILYSITMMQYIARYDAELLGKLKENRNLLLDKENELKEYRRSVTQYKIQAMNKKAELSKQLKERKTFLASIREDKKRQTLLLSDFEKKSAKLRALLERDTLYGHTSNFKHLKGNLIWPVIGKVSAPFGFYYDSVLKRKILNNGVRIQAPIGTDILSVAEGRVLYADWFCGYGKLLIIDHGEGYNSIYAHNSKLFVQEGQIVKLGERVAAVGDTESIRGPGLYFEIRFGGRPVDPIDWLGKK